MLLLGKNKLSDTYKKSGRRYYQLCGEDYLVTGVLGNTSSDLLDNMVVTYFPCLGDNARNMIFSSYQNYVIDLGSSHQNLSTIYQKVFLPENCTINYGEVSAEDYSPFTTEDRFSWMLFVFSAILIFITTDFLTFSRKKELLLCRLSGYTRLKIIHRFLSPVIKLTILAFVFYYLLFGLLSLIFRQIIQSYKLTPSPVSFLWTVGIICVSELFSLFLVLSNGTRKIR